MTQPRDPETMISMWLEDGPETLPVETRRAIEVGLRTQSRVRRTAFPGGITMLPLPRLASAAAILVAVGTVSLLFLSSPFVGVTSPGRTPPASTLASPSFSPTASPSTVRLDTSAWVTYSSARYGFDIGHPTSWTERPATRAWSFELDSDASAPSSPGADHFTSPDGSVRVSAWDVPLESRVDLDSRDQLLTWINDYCTRTGTAGCAGIRDRAVFFCNEFRDCHNAYLVPFDDWIGTFAWGGSIDGGVRVVAIWRSENEPQVAPYGGARALLEAFLSTMNIVPATGDQLDSAPLPSPSGRALFSSGSLTTYTSTRYGFSIAHPADWAEVRADHDWALPADANWLNTAAESFTAPGASVRVSAWSVSIHPAELVDRPTMTWIANTYCPLNTTPCDQLDRLAAPVTMDGHPGTLVQFADDTQAFVLIGDRMYVVAVWEPDSDPRTAPYGGAQRLLKDYLSTVRLLPAGPASAVPSAAPS